MYTFLLPDAGEGTHESQIVTWHFSEGDHVEEFDVLFEMESDKATVDIPSPVTGTIKKIHVGEGEIGIVGKPVVDILTEDDADEGSEADGDGDTGTQVQAEGEESKEPAKSGADHTPAQASGSASFPDDDKSTESEQGKPAEDLRTLAVPRVRVFARRNDVDLRQVNGTGNHGKITMEDVEAFLAGDEAAIKPAPSEPAVTAAGAGEATAKASAEAEKSEEKATCSKDDATCSKPKRRRPARSAGGERVERREPMTAIRRATNRALVASYTQAPHVTIMDRVDCTNLVAHRSDLKVKAADRDVKLTYTAYIVKAAVAMLKAHPELNAQVDMDAEEMIFFDDINIGVAMDTPKGLVVPVIREADACSLFDIATDITDFANAAKDGKLSGSDMKGGSLTITNVGGFATGGVWSTPIINGHESIIIGIGRIEEEFMPDEERQPVLTPMMKVSFTFDHRVVDGVAAQLALNDFKEFLADPNLLLAQG